MKSEPFEIDFSRHIPEIVSLPMEQVVCNMLSGKYDDLRVALILRYLVQSGYRFSTEDELLSLKHIVPGWLYYGNYELMLAHHFANLGYQFSMDDLQIMGNPEDLAGRTVAHYLANMGRIFSLDELRVLGNPATKDNGWTLAQYMAWAGHRFTVEEINELFRPDQVTEKWDVATAMVHQRYRFSTAEMDALGEDVCKAGYMGETLEKYMDRYLGILVGWQQASFRLVYAGDIPYFDLTHTHYSWDKKGSGLSIGFGYYAGGDVFAPENKFALTLVISELGWEAQLSTVYAHNRYDYMMQQIALNDLAARLQQSLNNHQDLDFSDYDQRFNEHCGYVNCEIYISAES